MSWLTHKLLVRRFVENDEPCPTEYIIEYYLDCKRKREPVPEKIDKFIDSILEKILHCRKNGQRTNYKEIFNFKSISGGKKSLPVTLDRILIIGDEMIKLMGEGMTYDDAAEKIAKERDLISDETVKKDFTEYKKYIL